jgi:hypothetical protein
MQWQRALGTGVLLGAMFALGLVAGLHWPVTTAQAQQGNQIVEQRLPNGVLCYTNAPGSGFSCVYAQGLAPVTPP